MILECIICKKQVEINNNHSLFYSTNNFFCSLECECSTHTERHKYPYEMRLKILNYHKHNITISGRAIAKHFNIPKDVVTTIIKRYGSPLYTKNAFKTQSIVRDENSRAFNDYKYFNCIDCENKAYFLGFIYGDGYINEPSYTLEITLKDSDKYLLEKFNRYLDNKGRLSPKVVKNNNKEYKACRFTIHSKTLINDLIRCGVMQNKSFIIKFPNLEIIPKDLMRHFIRGLLDSDGCLYIHKNSNSKTVIFLGNKDVLLGVKGFLESETQAKLNLNKKGRIYEMRAYGESALKILHFLYKDSNVYLERKFQIYEVFKNK